MKENTYTAAKMYRKTEYKLSINEQRYSCKKRKILSHSHLLKTELDRVKGVVILTYEKKIRRRRVSNGDGDVS